MFITWYSQLCICNVASSHLLQIFHCDGWYGCRGFYTQRWAILLWNVALRCKTSVNVENVSVRSPIAVMWLCPADTDTQMAACQESTWRINWLPSMYLAVTYLDVGLITFVDRYTTARVMHLIIKSCNKMATPRRMKLFYDGYKLCAELRWRQVPCAYKASDS